MSSGYSQAWKEKNVSLPISSILIALNIWQKFIKNTPDCINRYKMGFQISIAVWVEKAGWLKVKKCGVMRFRLQCYTYITIN